VRKLADNFTADRDPCMSSADPHVLMHVLGGSSILARVCPQAFADVDFSSNVAISCDYLFCPGSFLKHSQHAGRIALGAMLLASFMLMDTLPLHMPFDSSAHAIQQRTMLYPVGIDLPLSTLFHLYSAWPL
jgi:hypothetical protein